MVRYAGKEFRALFLSTVRSRHMLEQGHTYSTGEVIISYCWWYCTWNIIYIFYVLQSLNFRSIHLISFRTKNCWIRRWREPNLWWQLSAILSPSAPSVSAWISGELTWRWGMLSRYYVEIINTIHCGEVDIQAARVALQRFAFLLCVRRDSKSHNICFHID